MKTLSEPEYLQTMGSGPMCDVTAAPGEAIDVWPYVRSIATAVDLPSIVLQKELVEYVYRSDDDAFDHVLLSTGKRNIFLSVIISRREWTVYGHYLLDLNEKYGIKEEGA